MPTHICTNTHTYTDQIVQHGDRFLEFSRPRCFPPLTRKNRQRWLPLWLISNIKTENARLTVRNERPIHGFDTISELREPETWYYHLADFFTRWIKLFSSFRAVFFPLLIFIVVGISFSLSQICNHSMPEPFSLWQNAYKSKKGRQTQTHTANFIFSMFFCRFFSHWH